MAAKGLVLNTGPIIIERFFRTLKYNCIFINDFKNATELKEGINSYMGPCGRRPKNVDLDFRVVVEHQFARFLPLNIYIMLF